MLKGSGKSGHHERAYEIWAAVWPQRRRGRIVGSTFICSEPRSTLFLGVFQGRPRRPHICGQMWTPVSAGLPCLCGPLSASLCWDAARTKGAVAPHPKGALGSSCLGSSTGGVCPTVSRGPWRAPGCTQGFLPFPCPCSPAGAPWGHLPVNYLQGKPCVGWASGTLGHTGAGTETPGGAGVSAAGSRCRGQGLREPDGGDSQDIPPGTPPPPMADSGPGEGA